MGSFRRRLNGERGAAAVEFAIVSTILFIVVFGIIEFGRTYSQYEVMQCAAREGARRAAVGATLTQVQSAVTQAADPYTPSTPVTMDRTCTPDASRYFAAIDSIAATAPKSSSTGGWIRCDIWRTPCITSTT